MPIVSADRLTRIGAALLRAAGASDEEAVAVAVGCVNANLAGHDSHGVIAIPTYIDRIKAGHIVPLRQMQGFAEYSRIIASNINTAICLNGRFYQFCAFCRTAHIGSNINGIPFLIFYFS